jgi:hypothetical protein
MSKLDKILAAQAITAARDAKGEHAKYVQTAAEVEQERQAGLADLAKLADAIRAEREGR